MRVRASTDDGGLRWNHAAWNGISCSSFLILRYCSSHLRPIQSLLRSQGETRSHTRSLSTKSHFLPCHAERSEVLSMTGAMASDLLSERLWDLSPPWHLTLKPF